MGRWKWDVLLVDGGPVEMGRVICVLLAVAFTLLAQGCASGGGETLKIDVRHVAGQQHMPDELTAMLSDLGYQWIPILDPNVQRNVKVVQLDGEYRMRFEYVQTKRVRIDVRIRMRDGFTHLHFYEPASPALGEASRALLHKLQQRANLEFGDANVTY